LREIADSNRYKNVFIKKLREELKPSTVRNIHVIFIIMMNYAVDEGYLTSHKLRNAYTFEYVKSNNFLNVEEMVLFEKRAKSTLNITGYTAIFLLLQTGLRRAEALGLQWGDIDFERHTLSVNRIRDR